MGHPCRSGNLHHKKNLHENFHVDKFLWFIPSVNFLTVAKVRAYQSPWYRICTKAMVISKGSYVYGELKNVLPSLVQKTYLPVRGHKIPSFMG